LIGVQQFDKTNWENKLFATFAEAVEITAIQRGVDRWEPANFAATGTEDTKIDKNLRVHSCLSVVKNDLIELPFYPDLKLACGAFDDSSAEYASETIEIENPHGNLNPKKHFIVRASGDSMDGGNNPIKDGDFLLLELNTGGTISNQIFAVEYQDEFAETAYVLKRIEKQPDGTYQLVSQNKSYAPIPVDPEIMKPFARLLKMPLP